MRKWKLCFSAVMLAGAFSLAGCGTGASFEVSLGYSDGTIPAQDGSLIGTEYNQSLFYRNDLTVDTVADPHVIYVTEGEDAGKLFLYGTSDVSSNRGLLVWGSRDGITWDSYGMAFEPAYDSWSYTNIWAPEVTYDETTDMYYMVYCARNSNTYASGGDYYPNTYIGLAISESPRGPFIQYTGTNADGVEIGLGDPILDPAKFTAVNGVACEVGEYARYRFLDPSFYMDDDGQLYLYVSRGHDRYNVLMSEDEYQDRLSSTSDIWVIKMKDFSTPDYSTPTQLTRIGYSTMDGTEENDVDKERAASGSSSINEGAQMYRKGDTYYLTYSVGGAGSNFYSVAQAVGSSPMGPFRKLSKAEGGIVLGTELNWIQNAGTGHHCFTKIGDELFIFHHEGKDRYTVDLQSRALAWDRAGFMTNDAGQEVLVANGPTSYSLQALPTEFSGYRNIATEATVEANGIVAGSDSKYLNDGYFASHTYGVIKETEFDATQTITIKLSWDEYRPVSAIMMYNSIDYSKIFYQIARVKLNVRTEGGAEGVALIDKVYFPINETTCYSSMELMFAGSNLVMNFNEIEVNGIEITFRAPRNTGVVAIGDIWVLGK